MHRATNKANVVMALMTLLSVAHRFGSELLTMGGHHMAKIDLTTEH